jgi:chemotaxis protein CheX
MSTVPVQYINPFFAATKKICGEVIKVPVSAGPLRLRKADERIWKLFPVSAVINLGGAVKGIISLSFSESVAMALAEGLAQEKFPSFDDNARDALGEVTNLIVGSAKRDLPGGLVTISTPKIVATHQVEVFAGIPSLLLPFESTPGRFVMNLAMVVVETAAAAGASAETKPAVVSMKAAA